MMPSEKEMPPAISQLICAVENAACKEGRSSTTIHPITRYSRLENASNLPVKNNFHMVPKSAIPQTAARITHPLPCSKLIKQPAGKGKGKKRNV